MALHLRRQDICRHTDDLSLGPVYIQDQHIKACNSSLSIIGVQLILLQICSGFDMMDWTEYGVKTDGIG